MKQREPSQNFGDKKVQDSHLDGTDYQHQMIKTVLASDDHTILGMSLVPPIRLLKMTRIIRGDKEVSE